MAGENDDIFDEDETSRVIREQLEAAGFDDEPEDDGAGLDQPPPEGDDGDASVSADEGAQLASKARLKADRGETDNPKATKGDAKKADADDEEDGDDEAKAADGEKAEEEAEGGKDGDDAEDLTAAPIEDLLKRTPKKLRGEITRRLSDAEQALAPFRTPYIAQQMQAFGATPQQVASRLADLAAFASEKPDEYIAWVAQETAASPDKIGEVLQAAAARHGFKVVPAEAESDDDDTFDDEETRKLKARVRELEAAQRGGAPDFGPDVPARQAHQQAQQSLTAWQSERDPNTGQLKRPYFQNLAPQITEKARAHFQTTRQAVTTADLDRFYAEAVQEMASMVGGGATSAAQAAPGQADQNGQDAAAKLEKAKRASMNVDGAGQGAPRRPAQTGGEWDFLNGLVDKAFDG